MRVALRIAVLVGTFVVLLASAIADVPVTLTYTADNVVSAWWQDGSAPVPMGNNTTNWDNWQLATSDTISLPAFDHYEFIWQVQNGGDETGPGNPAGFLAEISSTVDANFHFVSNDDGAAEDLGVERGRWEWAPVVTAGPGSVPEWYSVVAQPDLRDGSQGTAYNGGDNIWSDVNRGPIGGIASWTSSNVSAAQWIWSDVNIPGQAGYQQQIYIRFSSDTIELVPEPACASLLGLSLLLLGCRRRRR